jgi:IAA-amino acid hydrolase
MRRVEEVVNATAASAGCAAVSWSWSPLPYPPLINDVALAELVAGVGQRLQAAAAAVADAALGGDSDVTRASVRFSPLAEPTMAAEDFSMFTSIGRIPSCFVFMGINSHSADGRLAGLHTPKFSMEEGRLALGAALHASVAFEALTRLEVANVAEAGADRSEL